MVIMFGFLVLSIGLVYGTLRVRAWRRRLALPGSKLPRVASEPADKIFHAPLKRVDDARLAAVILMIQIVRTGRPIMTSEKTRILDFMVEPLGIGDVSTVFARAWPYTQAQMPFARIAEDLVPLLCRRLTDDERLDLIDMLAHVAEAHGPASPEQSAAILRLKGRLISGVPQAGSVPRSLLRAG